MKEILNIIHKTIYQFFDACEDDEEVPMSDKDKLLLEVNKAICNNLKALEQTEPKKCSDCISRQVAIDSLMEIIDKPKHAEFLYTDEICRTLKALPPAQPNLQPTCNQLASDCISREVALEVLDDYAEDIECGNWGTAYSKARASMCELPYVEPERKTGKLKYTTHHGRKYMVCSQCGAERIYDHSTGWNYCPSCGAKMEDET